MSQTSINETIASAVRGILANTDLSNYRIEKVVKAEQADPASWGTGKPGEPREESVARYYKNIKSQSVLVNFLDRLQAKHGINYTNHLKGGI